MEKDNKVNFDLSVLTLEQLIEVYDKINEFLAYLDESKIEIEGKESNNE